MSDYFAFFFHQQGQPMSVMTCHFAKGKTCFNVQMETKWLPRPIGVDREWKKTKNKT